MNLSTFVINILHASKKVNIYIYIYHGIWNIMYWSPFFFAIQRPSLTCYVKPAVSPQIRLSYLGSSSIRKGRNCGFVHRFSSTCGLREGFQWIQVETTLHVWLHLCRSFLLDPDLETIDLKHPWARPRCCIYRQMHRQTAPHCTIQTPSLWDVTCTAATQTHFQS